MNVEQLGNSLEALIEEFDNSNNQIAVGGPIDNLVARLSQIAYLLKYADDAQVMNNNKFLTETA